MPGITKRISNFFRSDREARALIAEAAWTLAAAQAAVRLLSFRRLAPRLGVQAGGVAKAEITPAQIAQARRVGWAIRRLAPLFPWDVKCLGQAVAGKWMLQRRGLRSTLYLGVDRGQDTWLEAHAWLRCGQEFLTGAAGHERFKVIASFAEDWL